MDGFRYLPEAFLGPGCVDSFLHLPEAFLGPGCMDSFRFLPEDYGCMAACIAWYFRQPYILLYCFFLLNSGRRIMWWFPSRLIK